MSFLNRISGVRLAVMAMLLLAISAAMSQTLPSGFSTITVGSGWVQPLGSAFTKTGDQIYVWEKGGKVYVCNWNTSTNAYVKQSTPVLDIAPEVGNWRDHGLIGFALDPNFDVNGYIYLLYVVDRHHLLYYGTGSYNAGADEYYNATIGRISRYKVSLNGTAQWVADPASRTVLLGESKSTGFPILLDSHGIGSLVFASDGTLLASCGDGASYVQADYGSDPVTYYAQALSDGILRANENVGAFRAQMINSLNGKVIRIDPATGNGVSSNPFYSATSPRSAASRMWAMGFRNPFRFTIKPNTGSTDPATGDIGELYVGDVGMNAYEEITVVKAKASNCGWPFREGYVFDQDFAGLTVTNKDEPNPLYGTGGCTQQYFTFQNLFKQATADGNTNVYNPCNTSQVISSPYPSRFFHRIPLLEWEHSANNIARVGVFSNNLLTTALIGSSGSGVTGAPFGGNCTAGGTWYTGTVYPPQYQNTFFMADYGYNIIKSLTVQYTDKLTNVTPFASGFSGIVHLTQNPMDGAVYYIDIGAQTVNKIVYQSNLPPVAKASSDKNYGPSALTVNFASAGSSDPEGSTLTYSWDFGDGTALSTAASPSHAFTTATTAPKKFVVKLTVKDNLNATATDSVVISVNNTPPVVNITSPVKNSGYTIGPDTVYTLSASVTDAEHSSGQLFYQWQATLRHNNHEHPGTIDTNKTTSTVIQRVGCTGDTYSWFIKLTVTDAAGLVTVDSSKIFPICVTTPPSINVQPQPQTICEGSSVGFSSSVNDSPLPPVQWQVSTNSGSTWTNISGATNPLYSFVPVVGDNGKLFRAVWTNSIGSSISNSALLTVKTAPAAPTGSSLLSYCFVPTVADLTANGTALKWYSAATGGTALSGSTTLVSGSHYYASQTVNGCESVNRLDVTASINSAAYTSATLDGSSSTGTISSYSWSLVSGPNAPVFGTPNAATTTVSGLVKGNYKFQLSLNGGASTSLVQLNVNPDTGAVVPHAGYDRAITLPLNAVTLDGSGTTGSVTSYSWALLSGPNTPTLLSPAAVATQVTGLVQGNYSFVLSVKDSRNIIYKDTVAIGVGTATTGGSPVINATHTVSSTTNSAVNTLSGVAAGSLMVLSVSERDNGFTVFTNTQAIQPSAGASGNDGLALELGMKFRSSEDGYVTGVRFYKPTNNDAGSHIGELYTATGTRLAQVVFTGETATGWQQANFATPVSILKNTTYIVAYHCTAGNYHEYVNYFQNQAVSGPLTGLADGTDGSNGLYIYSNVPAFPTSTYSKTNYWVDAVFTKAHATVSSTPALTWTRRIDAMGALNSGNAEIYTSRFAAGGNISVTTSWSNGPMSTALYSISNYDTLLGGAANSVNLQSAASLGITTGRSYSTIIGVTADRNAVSGTSRSYRDAATETYYYNLSGGISSYHYRKPTTTATTYTEGLTAPTGMAAGTALYEVAAPAGPPPPPVADAGYNKTVQVAIAPAGDAIQSFCGAAALSNLAVTGNQVKWYSAASGGSPLSSGTSLVNGTHYYASQTVNGCESVQRLDVTAKVNAVPPPPSITEKKSCNGSAVLRTTAKGSLLWSTGAIVDSINVTTAGTYTLTVTDTSGCKSTASYTVTTSYNGYAASLNTQKNVLCYGESTGSLTVSATGPNTPFTYSLNNQNYQDSGTFNGLPAGNYVVYVRDAVSCILNVAVTVTQPASALSVSTTQTNVYAYGASTGSINVNASGGISPYQYSLDSATFQSTGSFSNLTAGSYIAYVKDNNSCATNKPVTIIQPASALNVGASGSSLLCYGDSTGTVTANGSGGIPPYQYKLNSGSYQNSNLFAKLKAGAYNLTIKDSAGIQSSTIVTVSQPGSPVAFSAIKSDIACATGTGSISFSASGGVGSYAYSINGGAAYQLSSSFTGLASGTYPLVVTDGNKCLSPSQSVIINVSSTAVTLSGSGSTGDSSYSWISISGPNTPVIASPAAKTTAISGLVQGSYIFELSVNKGASKSQVKVNVNAPSSPIVADAGNDRTITQPATSYTLNGGGSTGSIITYAWTLVSASNNKSVGFGSPNSVSTSVTGLDTGSYVFRLTVGDGLSTSSDDMLLRVNPVRTEGTAPVISSVNVKSSTTSTVTNSLTNVPKNALLVLTIAQGDDSTVTTNKVPVVTSSPALTWTKVAVAGAKGSGNAGIWRAVYAAGGKISITTKWGVNPISAVVYVITGYDAAFNGASAVANSQTSVSVPLPTSLSNSLLVVVTSDRKGVSGTGRAYLDAAVESQYQTKSGVYTAYHYRKPTTGRAAYTEGLSKPSGTLSAGTVIYEIRGPLTTLATVVADAGANQSIGCVASVTGGSNVKVKPQEQQATQIIGLTKLKVYPNPSAGFFHVDLKGWPAEELFLEVLDIDGKVVMAKEYPATVFNRTLLLDMRHLSSGTYFMKVGSRSRWMTTKLIKE